MVKTAELTGRELEATRLQVERTAAALYTDPRAAMRALLASAIAGKRDVGCRHVFDLREG